MATLCGCCPWANFHFEDVSDFIQSFMMASTSRKDALNVEQMETKDEMIDDVQVDVKDLVPPIKGSGKIEIGQAYFWRVPYNIRELR